MLCEQSEELATWQLTHWTNDVESWRTSSGIQQVTRRGERIEIVVPKIDFRPLGGYVRCSVCHSSLQTFNDIPGIYQACKNSECMAMRTLQQ